MHVPGRRNVSADYLSRFPSQITPTSDEIVDDECCMIAAVEVGQVSVCSESEWKEKLAEDNDLCAVISSVGASRPGFRAVARRQTGRVSNGLRRLRVRKPCPVALGDCGIFNFLIYNKYIFNLTALSSLTSQFKM
ncbi:hypothetical protein NDU88_000389 [Pleurodeles waltl]|uniref:Uncharacterized protein n=1 Tax=Pleurodeles waltl TaxID=8319 RepID=A0AAV7U4G9_PLEWA|nr:hypothetical protein NDU88_000389 [Pleurodeles waltl]